MPWNRIRSSARSQKHVAVDITLTTITLNLKGYVPYEALYSPGTSNNLELPGNLLPADGRIRMRQIW